MQRQNQNGRFDRKIGIWCNGNTTDSGPVFPGSNPGIPTHKPLIKDKVLLNDLEEFFSFLGLAILKIDQSKLVSTLYFSVRLMKKAGQSENNATPIRE